jgi:hypothetical protein
VFNHCLREKNSQATVDKKDLFVSSSAIRNPFAAETAAGPGTGRVG